MTSSGSAPLGGHERSKLKADHPRAIDRFIDYFGNGATTSSIPSVSATPVPPIEEPAFVRGTEG